MDRPSHRSVGTTMRRSGGLGLCDMRCDGRCRAAVAGGASFGHRRRGLRQRTTCADFAQFAKIADFADFAKVAKVGMPAIGVGLVVLSLARVTFADAPASTTGPYTTNGTNGAAEATALFYDARNLMARGQYGEACPKLERSLAIDPGIGTRFNLANCYEHVGKLASAWAGFDEVARRAAEAGQAERERIARGRAKSLEGRLPRVILATGAMQDAGAEIRRDGVVIPRSEWSAPIPVDPGTHTLTVTAPDKEPWETTIVAVEAKTVAVTVPRLLVSREAAFRATPAPPVDRGGPPVDVPPATSATTETTQGTMPVSFPPPVVESRGGAQRTVGFVLTGVGIASLGVAGGFGLHSLSKHDDAKDHCVGNACDATGMSLRRQARTSGNVSTITAIAGGAVALTGIVLTLTAPSSRTVTTGSAKTRGKIASITPDIEADRNGASLVLHGVFP